MVASFSVNLCRCISWDIISSIHYTLLGPLGVFNMCFCVDFTSSVGCDHQKLSAVEMRCFVCQTLPWTSFSAEFTLPISSPGVRHFSRVIIWLCMDLSRWVKRIGIIQRRFLKDCFAKTLRCSSAYLYNLKSNHSKSQHLAKKSEKFHLCEDGGIDNSWSFCMFVMHVIVMFDCLFNYILIIFFLPFRLPWEHWQSTQKGFSLSVWKENMRREDVNAVYGTFVRDSLQMKKMLVFRIRVVLLCFGYRSEYRKLVCLL